MLSRKSSKQRIFTYDELMAMKRMPRKPFYMLPKEHKKLESRKEKLESTDRNKLPKGFDLKKERLRVKTLLSRAKPMRGDSLALYEMIKLHQRSKEKRR